MMRLLLLPIPSFNNPLFAQITDNTKSDLEKISNIKNDSLTVDYFNKLKFYFYLKVIDYIDLISDLSKLLFDE